MNIPGPDGTGAFAVAMVNVGVGAPLTVSADTGGVSMPLTLFMCRTNAVTGQCNSAIGPTVLMQADAGATATLAVFIAGSGMVPFEPAGNRVFVRFKDAGGVVRGGTSVAVRTQ